MEFNGDRKEKSKNNLGIIRVTVRKLQKYESSLWFSLLMLVKDLKSVSILINEIKRGEKFKLGNI